MGASTHEALAQGDLVHGQLVFFQFAAKMAGHLEGEDAVIAAQTSQSAASPGIKEVQPEV